MSACPCKPAPALCAIDVAQLGLDAGGGALLLEQLARSLALCLLQAALARFEGVELAAVHVGERDLAVGICQLTSKRDRVATVCASVHSYQHVLEHGRLLWIAWWRC